MSIKSRLKHSLHVFLQQDKRGSFATRYDRQRILSQFFEEIHALGFKIESIQQLKLKHIQKMVAHWQQKSLSNATIKNRLAAVRYLGIQMNKPQLVPSNTVLQVGKRHHAKGMNRAVVNVNFEKITDPHLRISLELQRVFGLRREESLKIKPHAADNGASLVLQPSWCKGGRGRIVPIRTTEQRYWLEEAKKLTPMGTSMIPKGKSYIQQRYLYDKQIARAGLKNLHGLRHAYAQQRYREITGWEAPINGGPKACELTAMQKAQDHRARMILTEELGHSREQITENYCGK